MRRPVHLVLTVAGTASITAILATGAAVVGHGNDSRAVPNAERTDLCYSGDVAGHPTGEICVPLIVPLPTLPARS